MLDPQIMLETLASTMKDSIVIIDTSGIVHYANKSVEMMFGLQVSEVLDRNVTCLIPTEVSKNPESYIQNYSETEEIHKIEKDSQTVKALHSNGDKFPICLTVTPFESGGQMWFMEIIKDMTEIYSIDNKLTEQTEISKAKDAFLSCISHEIRTPLNGIVGMAELIANTVITSYQQECIQIINACSHQLLDLINNILDYSKIMAGKMTIHSHRFNLGKCLHECHSALALKADEKKINLYYIVDPNIPTFVEFDSKMLRQIIMNLLSNALKFTKSGSVHTEVKLLERQRSEAVEKEGENDGEQEVENERGNQLNLEFRVQDSGMGISAEDMKYLFLHFSQIQNRQTFQENGTGLGLAITKELVHLGGGEISVESTPDHGSTFIFNLHMDRPRELKIDTFPEETEFITETGTSSLLEKTHIVIVDDNHINRKIYAQHIINWGAIPYMASSADEALMYLCESSIAFDLVLVDICMPKMNGLDLAIKLRELKVDIPLVAISSISDIQDYPQFQARLVKPINSEKLFSTCLRMVRLNNSKSPELLSTTSTSSSSSNGNLKNHLINPLANVNSISLPSPMSSRSLYSNSTSSPHYGSLCPTPSRLAYNRICAILVDDNRINRQVGVAMLNRVGVHMVDTADNGPKALRMIKKKNYDIVFLDIKMPEMDGYEVSNLIIEHVSNQHLPCPRIVAMTAHVLDNARQRCNQSGMHGFISKPVNLESIERQLSYLVNNTCTSISSTTPTSNKSTPSHSYKDASALQSGAN